MQRSLHSIKNFFLFYENGKDPLYLYVHARTTPHRIIVVILKNPRLSYSQFSLSAFKIHVTRSFVQFPSLPL